jgi:signal transduction histidine kinase
VVNDREVQYSNLPPRHYRFRVIACNNSGVWNEKGDVLNFSIDPAYYQTGWFASLLGGAVLLGLWGFHRYRLHRLAHEYNVRLEERVVERTRIARDLHDTLLQTFQGLTLRFQVVDEMLPPGSAKDELQETMECGDKAVIEARNAVHDLRLSTTTSNDLAEALRALGDELASHTTATFRLVVEGPPRELHPIVRDEVYRIAREALRNAAAHGAANHVEAEITYDKRFLRLRVRDDGKGIPAEILEKGRAGHFGLSGMRERARAIGAKLTISSGQGMGTEVALSVPASVGYAKPPRWARLWPFRRVLG